MAPPTSTASTAGPATRTVSKSSIKSTGNVKGALDYGYPHGHLGHLTPEEEATFAAFKTDLASAGLYKPGPPASHPDTVLLRFLRARRWVIADARAQFKDTEEWRQNIQLDVLYDSIDVEAYEQSRRLYPQWTGRRDKRGIPVYLFEIRHLDPKTVTAYEKAASSTFSRAVPNAKTGTKLVRLFALYENLTRFAQPLCTQLTDREHPSTPITLSTNIVDVSGVSLRGYWNLKNHMQAASELATAHYPETLDRIFIIGAPAFFTTVWGWIKRWFDPVTVSKIFVLSHAEVLPTLNSFIHIDDIPKQYGGKLDFNWCQMPNLDPKIRELATWENGYTEFPEGPVYWVPTDDGKRLECLARGSVNKVQRNDKVCSIPVAYPEGPLGHQEDDAAVTAPVLNGNTAAAAAAAAAADDEDEFQDAPEEPIASPPTDDAVAKAVEGLSLQDNKTTVTTAETAVNGNPVGA
ncbi:CRAL/TRIO domain-containing protein [Coniella lustricola]|uniref:CRAL/TRIO domain-containing protein n=1 Tax=Coniella lustricola TaxID=2025994 RepID=A0A2T2ZSZ1_9PEZI|nr:CRAL/TRIO domain-containing protein [Coniella lustricola]